MRRHSAGSERSVDRPGVGSWTRTAVRGSYSMPTITSSLPQRSDRGANVLGDLPSADAERPEPSSDAGEIFGGWYGSVSERKRRIDVTLRLRAGARRASVRFHAIFARAGGASEYDDLGGIHVYSSVNPTEAASIVPALRRLHLTPARYAVRRSFSRISAAALVTGPVGRALFEERLHGPREKSSLM